MENATLPLTPKHLVLAAIGAACALACSSAEGLSDCRAQQQALRARQQVLEARVERLELLLSLQPPRPGPKAATAPRAVRDGDPFAQALSELDEPPVIQRADALLALVEQNPSHPRAPEALLLSAEALLRAEEWVLADWTFERVARGWPSSPHAWHALWGRAQSALARGRVGEARTHLGILAVQRDAGALALRAREALEKIGQEGDGAQKQQ